LHGEFDSGPKADTKPPKDNDNPNSCQNPPKLRFRSQCSPMARPWLG